MEPVEHARKLDRITQQVCIASYTPSGHYLFSSLKLAHIYVIQESLHY